MKCFGSLLVLSLSAAPVAAVAEGGAIFDGGWRISAGAVYDSGPKTKMHLSPRQDYRSPFSPTPGALTRDKAELAGKGTTDGTKTTYKNGDIESWIDSNDPATGYDSGETRHYRFSKDIWNGDTEFQLGYAEWEDILSWQTPYGDMESFDTDNSALPGINVELSRNLYHDAEYGWGVDAAFAVQYSRRNNAFRSRNGWVIGGSRKSNGYYGSKYNATGDLADLLTYSGEGAEYIQQALWDHADGSYLGSGGDPDAYNDPIDPNDIRTDNWENPNAPTDVSRGSLSVDGDYENLELMLLARPYYDVYDWLRINGTLGVVVSRQSMEMSFSMLRDGEVDYRSNRDYSQWDVYGVGGLGLMLYFKDFTLSADFMARFLDEEMMVEDLYYRGSVRRGHWMFRLAAGYEF